ncbi:class I SAM-dependent methyltransferase [Chryseobacterium sp. ISL-6]|uniref:class I SAM-dependent methyltransferase n=1 Tax=Chryseobacterium sp. ISL-6 TaxID=2819143 RepID=UPI001BE852E9|nr:class I SAM-dependent methyltransferase [Chryseobacterium sp. ISL-6]MBT2620298.1 class I SAM-dependent methyltransferase [Chryseobacterium sp. ISL-6]
MNTYTKTNVPLTSALVLQQSNSVYTSDLEKKYLEHIDFSGVMAASQEMTTATTAIRDIICLRKNYIRKALSEQLLSNPKRQILILGAGLDPLSIFLLEHHADRISDIFEVDGSDTILTKAVIYSDLIPTTNQPHFIQCNLADTNLLMETLLRKGFQPEKPTIVVLEGVVHYIHNHEFVKLMQQFESKGKYNKVIMEYCLDPVDVPAHGLSLHNTVIGLFEKFIKDKVRVYFREEMMEVLTNLGVIETQVVAMKDVEFQLNGNNLLFHQQGEGLVEMLVFKL